MTIDLRFFIFIDSPSICIYVISSPVGLFIRISKGPFPCIAFAPERVILSSARFNSDLNCTNQSSPSSTFCQANEFLGLMLEIVLVFQTFLNPAMQLVQLRQTIPQQPDLKGYNLICQSFIIRSSSILLLFSVEDYISFSSILSICVSVTDCTVCYNFFIGRKKFKNPISPYATLLRKAFGVLWRSTVQTTRASNPIPTQLENIFLKLFSDLSISLWSFVSQILPFSKVYTFTSHISQNPIVAFIHYFTKTASGLKLFAEIFTGFEPHPRLRLKSFPVPIGMIPITILARSRPTARSYDKTHGIVPSPPQTITLKLTFQLRQNSNIFYIPLFLESWLKRSEKQRNAFLLESNLMIISSEPSLRQLAPQPSPLLVLTNSIK